MKKILIILMGCIFLVSCSTVKRQIEENQVNRLISQQLNTVIKTGIVDIEIKHIKTNIKQSRLYSKLSVELKGIVSTAPIIVDVSYTVYFKNGKLKLYQPRVESINDANGNPLKIDSPLVKEPLNILIKYITEKEITDFNNLNIPFDKVIKNIQLEGNKLGLYLK